MYISAVLQKNTLFKNSTLLDKANYVITKIVIKKVVKQFVLFM